IVSYIRRQDVVTANADLWIAVGFLMRDRAALYSWACAALETFEGQQENAMTTVKMNFTLLGGLSLALGIFTAGSLTELSRASADKARAYDNRYQSYLLAGELRQSSDDLTRLGRTYVVTGDKSYKQQYMDILAIRNGEKPRPQAYNRIYWDFVAAGN